MDYHFWSWGSRNVLEFWNKVWAIKISSNWALFIFVRKVLKSENLKWVYYQIYRYIPYLKISNTSYDQLAPWIWGNKLNLIPSQSSMPPFFVGIRKYTTSLHFTIQLWINTFLKSSIAPNKLRNVSILTCVYEWQFLWQKVTYHIL
jgi:hypothetical protein